MLDIIIKLMVKFFFIDEWNIGVLPRQKVNVVGIKDLIRSSNVSWLDKRFNFQADPFIVEIDDLIYIFYEAMDLFNSKGEIRCRILSPDFKELCDQLVIFDNNIGMSHVSFPYIFYENGSYFLIPETSELKKVFLYESSEFPFRWTLSNTLVEHEWLTDNVVVEHGGLYYLLSTDKDNNLVVHSSGSLAEGSWINNKLDAVFANGHSRSAGSPIKIKDTCYLLTQECLANSYGNSVYIKKLSHLSRTEYREELVCCVEKIPGQYSSGIHTLNLSENYVVIDAKRKKFFFYASVMKFVYKLKCFYRRAFVLKGNI